MPRPVPAAAPRRTAERARRRGEILAAAIRLFAERGPESVTPGDIAKATRLSRPLIYFYFPDQPALFFEALRLSSEELRRRFLAAVRPGDSGLAQILAIGHTYVAFARERPELFALLAHNESKLSPEELDHPGHQLCQQTFQEIQTLMVAAIEQGKRDGSIRRDVGEARAVSAALWGLTHGVIQLAATKGPTLEKKGVEDFPHLPELGLTLLTRGLERKPAPR